MVDPGLNFVWGKDELDSQKTHNLDLVQEDRLRLIKKYLDIERVAIPGANFLMLENDTNSEPRSRSNSNCGSVDSDDQNGGSNGNGKDKTKIGKQLNTITKSFGSIGKSMSKKWKKNFGGSGRGMKMGDSEKNNKRKTSVGSVTQSTKRTSVTVEMLGDRDHILCVRLSYKRAEYQEEMVKNYIIAAEERFKLNRELRRKQVVEMRQKAEHRRNDLGGISPMHCVNVGCENLGSSATSYLCPACFQKEKQQAIDFERRPPSVSHQDESDYSSSQDKNPSLDRTDTLTTWGKSKFYTMVDEDHSQGDQRPPPPSYPGLNNTNSGPNVNRKEALHLARSSFYAETDIVTGKPPIDPRNSTTQSGTAYIVNNLYENVTVVPPGEGKDSMPYGTIPARLSSQKAIDIEEEPPLGSGCSKSKVNHVPSRKHAFKIKNIQDDISSKMKESCTVGGMQQTRCKNDGCPFYGNSATEYFCSTCFKECQRTLAYKARMNSH